MTDEQILAEWDTELERIREANENPLREARKYRPRDERFARRLERGFEMMGHHEETSD